MPLRDRIDYLMLAIERTPFMAERGGRDRIRTHVTGVEAQRNIQAILHARTIGDDNSLSRVTSRATQENGTNSLKRERKSIDDVII